jgi:hypothetical protein
MIFSMYMLVLFPIAGIIGDTYSLKVVFIGLSLVELALGLLYCLMKIKQSKGKQEIE